MNNCFKNFEPTVFNNLSKENYTKILNFLSLEIPDYIEDIVNNYLDLFLIEYNEFVIKYNKLKNKYGLNFVKLDMSLLEQMYII